MKKVSLIALALFLPLLMAGTAGAQTVPAFPQCINPQGTLRVEYNSGTHGIPGDPGEYNGSDAVYQVSEDTLIQCFCAEDGSAIQTNWWRVSQLSQEDIESLEAQGWNFIPDGSLWGLEEAAYLARNSSYRCKEEDRVGGASATAEQSPVLKLADTGGLSLPLLLALIGALSLANGLRLLKRAR